MRRVQSLVLDYWAIGSNGIIVEIVTVGTLPTCHCWRRTFRQQLLYFSYATSALRAPLTLYPPKS